MTELLKPGTILQNGTSRFEILDAADLGVVLDQDAYSIHYVAIDIGRKKIVDIFEYFRSGFCVRKGQDVIAKSDPVAEQLFQTGREQFLDRFKFQKSNGTNDVTLLEANNTHYAVVDFDVDQSSWKTEFNSILNGHKPRSAPIAEAAIPLKKDRVGLRLLLLASFFGLCAGGLYLYDRNIGASELLAKVQAIIPAGASTTNEESAAPAEEIAATENAVENAANTAPVSDIEPTQEALAETPINEQLAALTPSAEVANNANSELAEASLATISTATISTEKLKLPGIDIELTKAAGQLEAGLNRALSNVSAVEDTATEEAPSIRLLEVENEIFRATSSLENNLHAALSDAVAADVSSTPIKPLNPKCGLDPQTMPQDDLVALISSDDAVFGEISIIQQDRLVIALRDGKFPEQVIDKIWPKFSRDREKRVLANNFICNELPSICQGSKLQTISCAPKASPKN